MLVVPSGSRISCNRANRAGQNIPRLGFGVNGLMGRNTKPNDIVVLAV